MRYFFSMAGAIAGTALCLLLLVALYFGALEAGTVTDSPLRLTMREAVDRAASKRSAWVWLTDAQADCKRSAPFTDYSKSDNSQHTVLFVAANAARDMEVVVEARDLKQCDYIGNVHYVGILKRVDDDQRRYFAGKGLQLPAGGGPAWWLCGDCKPGGEWGAVMAVSLFLVFVAWMTWRIFRARVKPVPLTEPAQPAQKVAHGSGKTKKRRNP